MTVSSTGGTLKSNDQTTREVTSNDLDQNIKINLNDVLSDLKKMSVLANNLAVALSIYLTQEGKLDPTRFKLLTEKEKEGP